MKHRTTCKFCKKAVLLAIDPSYDALADPQKLIPLAACNRCADLREEKRRLTERIARICGEVQSKPKDETFRGKSLLTLSTLVPKYCSMVARWTGVKFQHDESIAEAMAHNPKEVYDILSRLWPEKREYTPEMI